MFTSCLVFSRLRCTKSFDHYFYQRKSPHSRWHRKL